MPPAPAPSPGPAAQRVTVPGSPFNAAAAWAKLPNDHHQNYGDRKRFFPLERRGMHPAGLEGVLWQCTESGKAPAVSASDCSDRRKRSAD